MKNTKEMQILSDRYWSVKMLFNSALSGDSKAKELVRQSLTVAEACKLAEFVADCEALNVDKIERVKN